MKRNEQNLTSRQLSVAQNVAMGLSNREIAEKLFITEKTVKYHLTYIFKILGVKRRTQIVHALNSYTLQAVTPMPSEVPDNARKQNDDESDQNRLPTSSVAVDPPR